MGKHEPQPGPRDYLLACVHGVGDTYAVASLAHAFKQKYCCDGEKLFLCVKEAHFELACLFPAIDGVRVELSGMPSRPNVFGPGKLFFTHPSFAPVRGDHCVACHQLSDVSMYAMILGLDPRVEPTRPQIPLAWRIEAQNYFHQIAGVEDKTVLLVDKSNSWPSPPYRFWHYLRMRLSDAGYLVLFNNDPYLPFRYVDPFLEKAGWVIGANCGFMQFIVSSQVNCRKTIITQSMLPDSAGLMHSLPIESTLAYRNFRKIDGNKYDIEEYRIAGPESYEHIVRLIVTGRNAMGPKPSPEPYTVVDVETSPGELLDRLTILQVKAEKLPTKAHMLYREIEYLTDIRNRLARRFPDIESEETTLRRLNVLAWDYNEHLIRAFPDGKPYIPGSLPVSEAERLLVAWSWAHNSNQARVKLKNKIDQICRSAGKEEKSWL